MRNINVNQNFDNIEVKEFRTILPYKSIQNRLSLENNQERSYSNPDIESSDENIDKEVQIPHFLCHASNQLKNKGGNFAMHNSDSAGFRPIKLCERDCYQKLKSVKVDSNIINHQNDMPNEEKHIVKKFTGFLQPNNNINELGRLYENMGTRGKHRLITNSTVTRSYLTSTVDWQGKIAGLNNKSSKIDDGAGYLPFNTAVHNQVIQEENENFSQHEECKYKASAKHKNSHTIHQHQLKLPSKESESISVGHNRREEILNADRMERSRTMSSKNSFYCCSKIQSGESSNCIIF